MFEWIGRYPVITNGHGIVNIDTLRVGQRDWRSRGRESFRRQDQWQEGYEYILISI
jgi:hypothetical protein